MILSSLPVHRTGRLQTEIGLQPPEVTFWFYLQAISAGVPFARVLDY